MADLRIVDAPVLLQESITDDVKMPTGGLGNYAIRLGDLVWYVVAKENLASKSYVDNSSKGVQDKLDIHVSARDNPHQVTKQQVGLGNVDNTADIDKPVSNAVSSAIITATTDMATKTYVNQKDNLKADKATTLNGYGITDAYTKDETFSKTEVGSALSSKADTSYVDNKDGDLTALKTSDKSNLVKSINEIYSNTKDVIYLYNKNVEVGAGVNGWDDTLIALPFGRTQRQKNFDIVSVKDYGAKGDGVTDETTAINNAFKSGAGIIILPACKEYLIKGSIYPKSNTIILSAGATIKYFDQTANFTIADAHNVVVQGVKIDGNQTAWTGWQGSGINIFRSSYITLRDCEVFNTANIGINVGQTENHEEYLNNNILIDNCYIHDIGSPSITAFYAYGNGIAVCRGKDVVIRNNRIDNVWDIGGINLEGLVQENVQIVGNRITNMTGKAPAIKLYAGGIDDYADYVTIKDNIISDVYGNNGTEPAIFVRSGGKLITLDNNKIYDSLSDGIYVAASEDITIKDNKIINCPNATYTINTANKSIVFKDNYIRYPDGATDKPIWIETKGTVESIAQVSGNTVENAPSVAFMLGFRTPSVFKDNIIINCRKNGTKGYGVKYANGTNFGKSIIGGNLIKDTLGNTAARFTAFYDFSGNHENMTYLADTWDTTESITKFDMYANNAFIKSSVAIRETPPSVGTFETNAVCLNANFAYTPVQGWIYSANKWKPYGQVRIYSQSDAELKNASHDVNQRFKYSGAMAFNVNDGKLYYAISDVSTDVWRTADNSNTISPV